MSDERPENCREVHRAAEGFYTSDPDGSREYILFGGEKVRSFQPCWSPEFVYCCSPGLNLLALRHIDGRCATWFLDQSFACLCDSVAGLPQPCLEALRTAAHVLRSDIWTQFMLRPIPALQPTTRAFLQLNETTRAQVLAAASDWRGSDAVLIDLSSDSLPTLRCEIAGADQQLQKAILQTIIQTPIKDCFVKALKEGKLTWPSPIDGTPMRLLGGVFVDDFRFAYRMVDERVGLVVMVVVTEHHERTVAIFLPQASLIVVLSNLDAHVLETHFGHLGSTLERHFWTHAPVLEAYFGAHEFTFASVLRGRPGVHIGHQLWNELAPIEELVRNIPPENQLLFLVPNAGEGTEIYGPLDVLFPELGDRVLRFFDDVATVSALAYTRRLCVTRITDLHVPANLRRRILAVANATPAGREAAAAAEAFSARGLPIVLVGLRVENRTLVELSEFLIVLIERILGRVGPAVFVVDGHNRRLDADPDNMIASHMEHVAATRPHDVERQIVDVLQAHFTASEAYIISTIGNPISSSLVWSSQSQMLFAVWGAGLAKYRWVANLPGFVMSNAWNLRHKADLRIYDSPQYMENPTQLIFVNPDHVTDRPDLRPLVGVEGGQNPLSYMNFDVSVDSIWPQIDALLEALIIPMRRPENRFWTSSVS